MNMTDKTLGPEDCANLLACIGDTLKSQRKMTQTAKELGVTREGLYKSFNEKGNPSFQTVIHTLKLLGMGVTIHPLQQPEKSDGSTEDGV